MKHCAHGIRPESEAPARHRAKAIARHVACFLLTAPLAACGGSGSGGIEQDPGGAGDQAVLEVQEGVVRDFIVDVIVRLPPGYETGELLLDGAVQPFELPAEWLTLNTSELDDGDHRLGLRLTMSDGQTSYSEVTFRVDNPSVSLDRIDPPSSEWDDESTVWPGASFGFDVHTAGPVAYVEANVGAVLGTGNDWRRLEMADADRYHLELAVPSSVPGFEEGKRRMSLRIHAIDGDELNVEGIEVCLAAHRPMPMRSPAGPHVPLTPDLAEGGTTSRIPYVSPTLADAADASKILDVAIQGDTTDLSLLIMVDGRSGHLIVPLENVERVDPADEVVGVPPTYRIPVELSQAPDVEEVPLRFGLREATGYVLWQSDLKVVTVRAAAPPPEYVIQGRVSYTYPEYRGGTETRSADGVLAFVYNSLGNFEAAGFADYNGCFRLKVSPTYAPLRIEFWTSHGPLSVFASEATPGRYVYGHPGSLRPLSYQPLTVDVTIPLSASEPFHIFAMGRRAIQWFGERGMDLAQAGMDLVWRSGEGILSEYSRTGRVILAGAARFDDAFNESVILHEIGHMATARFSKSSSPGGRHAGEWTDPTLAWAEGMATYLGQSILGHAHYRDRNQLLSRGYWITNVPYYLRGSAGGLITGALSELVVSGFLWDLADGVENVAGDLVEGLEPDVLRVWREMRDPANLGAGVSGADLADFVKLLACPAPDELKVQLHILLSLRFDLDWLALGSGLCN